MQRARIGELEAELAEQEIRRKRASNNNSNNNSGRASSLRESEDRYLKEERLKDDLDLARHQKLELETALLDRDARAIESRFDLEASELEVVRLKRRVKELEAAYKALNTTVNIGGGGSLHNNNIGVNGGIGVMNKGAGTAGKVGSSSNSRKEQELEGVVEAMKRLVDKLKAENDRLKKGSGHSVVVVPGSTTSSSSSAVAVNTGDAIDRKYQAEKKRAAKLEEENTALIVKVKGLEDTGQKVVQRQQQVAMLRKQLKSKDDELNDMREQVDEVTIEKETAKKRVVVLQERVNELEIQLHQQQQQQQQQSQNNNTNRNGSNNTPQQQQQLQREMQELRNQNASQANENESLRAQLAEMRTNYIATDRSSYNNNNAAETQRLKQENMKLRQELSAFDLDFFEEIENLKYAHAEAVRKLKLYENIPAGGDVRDSRGNNRSFHLGSR